MTSKRFRVTVALGSNYQARDAINKGIALLGEHLTEMSVSSVLETAPIGITSGSFLNCVATGFTDLSADQLIDLLKQTEYRCGDRKSLRRKHIILLDIDLLEYDGIRHHTADWERDYIQALVGELRAHADIRQFGEPHLPTNDEQRKK